MQWMLSLHLTVGASFLPLSLSLVVSVCAWLSSLLPHLVLISMLYSSSRRPTQTLPRLVKRH